MDLKSKLTVVPQSKDVYGSEIANNKPGYGESVPNGRENPDMPFREDAQMVCKTCGTEVGPEGLASPEHLGHALEYGNGALVTDVSGVARKGGSYRIGFETDGTEPNEGA